MLEPRAALRPTLAVELFVGALEELAEAVRLLADVLVTGRRER